MLKKVAILVSAIALVACGEEENVSAQVVEPAPAVAEVKSETIQAVPAAQIPADVQKALAEADAVAQEAEAKILEAEMAIKEQVKAEEAMNLEADPAESAEQMIDEKNVDAKAGEQPAEEAEAVASQSMEG